MTPNDMAEPAQQQPDEYGRELSGARRHMASRLLAPLVWIAMAAMAALTFVDVVGRYCFNSPVKGAFEVIELLMGITIFAGLPIVTAQREHIVVSLFDAWFDRSAAVRSIRRVVVDLVSVLGASGLAWFVANQALEMQRYGNTEPFLEWPIAPFVFFMSLMCVATVVIVLLQLIETVRDL